MTNPDLEAILERPAIIDTVVRCATGVDIRDWELYHSCFTDEIDVDFTSFSDGDPSHMTGDAWVERVRTTLPEFEATQYINTNHVVTLEGDEATCVSYMQGPALPFKPSRRQYRHARRLLYESSHPHARRLEDSPLPPPCHMDDRKHGDLRTGSSSGRRRRSRGEEVALVTPPRVGARRQRATRQDVATTVPGGRTHAT